MLQFLTGLNRFLLEALELLIQPIYLAGEVLSEFVVLVLQFYDPQAPLVGLIGLVIQQIIDIADLAIIRAFHQFAELLLQDLLLRLAELDFFEDDIVLSLDLLLFVHL